MNTDQDRLTKIINDKNVSREDILWLISKVAGSLICGAVYKSNEWPHQVICVRRPGHGEDPSPTWRDHRGHPESEAWEWDGE